MRRPGFTLIETALALFVTAIAIITIGFVTQTSRQHLASKTDEQLSWYYFLSEIESEKYRFTVEQISKQRVCLMSQTKKRLYILKFRVNELVLTTPQGGYLPLMRGIKKASFHNGPRGVICVADGVSQTQYRANLLLEDSDAK